jgi:nucleoside-diphosphate-sugar epimerase
MDLRGRTVAVTGATGFLGRYIVDVLLHRGARVVGVVRNPQRVPELLQRGVEMRKADLADPTALAEGFRGTDAVVSNAALFAVTRMLSFNRRGWQEHERTNVQGTENVMQAVAAAGVRRVVHVSSVAVYAKLFAPNIDESFPQLTAQSRHTPMNAYQISKALSEQAAWALARKLDLQLTTVRPCTIYGAFDPNFMAVVRRLLSGPVGILPLGLQLPLVYGGDVAEGIARALERPESIGKAYNLTGENLPLGEFVKAWRAVGLKTGWTLPFPLPLRQSLSHARAAQDLGWKNRPYTEALRETLQFECRNR